ncbi:hypothetical protein NDU88_003365 [Pleurodeles waltl]|uniref:Uncharacterized protein n=1 Tax=Pleurodeles waltl TaxID=8319 RepID=A0AAV7MUE0_PLEWA|nr:hypothetical protein NDU88_003365 [Pleurodeles waltl]
MLYGGDVSESLPPAPGVVLGSLMEVKKAAGWTSRLTLETPLWRGAYLLQLVVAWRSFTAWDTIGISTLGDVLHKGVLKSFQELRKNMLFIAHSFSDTYNADM